MIQLIDVKKGFDENVLFESFNLQIDNGEFVIISGDSGSGKTTLLNMIGALLVFCFSFWCSPSVISCRAYSFPLKCVNIATFFAGQTEIAANIAFL
ncbi:MAG: ATP-binding cassette domain-containing protein [Oscillospiraceae bacterium]